MAAYIPIADVAKIELIHTQDSQRVENVYHVHKSSGAWDATTLTAMCAVFKGWFDASLKAQVSSGVSLVLIVATDQTSKTAPRVEYTTGLPIAGTNAGTVLPNNATCAISWRTALRGRSYRGRTYHIGLTQTQVTANTVGAGTLTALSTAYAALMTAVNTSGYQLVVASRFQDHLPLLFGVATPITAITIDGSVDSQRRRLPGRGK